MTRIESIRARLEAAPAAGLATSRIYQDLQFLLRVAEAARRVKDARWGRGEFRDAMQTMGALLETSDEL